MGPRSALYGQRLLENGIALLEPDFAGALAEDMPLPPAASACPWPWRRSTPTRGSTRSRLVVLGLGEGARAALLGGAAGDAAGAALSRLRRRPGGRRGPARRPRCCCCMATRTRRTTRRDCARLAAAFPQPATVRHRVLAGASYGWDAYDLVRPGGLTRLQDPAGSGRRTWSRPDLTTTVIAADRVLGLRAGRGRALISARRARRPARP